MEPLTTAKQVLIWLCVCPVGKFTTKCEKMAHIMCATVIFFGQLSGVACHLTYLLMFGSVDLKDSVFSFSGTVGFTGIVYITITVYSMRYQMNDILEQLSNIYSNRKFSFFSVYKIVFKWDWEFKWQKKLKFQTETPAHLNFYRVQMRRVNGFANFTLNSLYLWSVGIYSLVLFQLWFVQWSRKILISVKRFISQGFCKWFHTASNSLNTNHDKCIFAEVCHGIRTLFSATSLKRISFAFAVHRTWWQMVWFYCFSSWYAFIIKHFIKCLNVRSSNGMIWMSIKMIKNLLSIAYVFIFW